MIEHCHKRCSFSSSATELFVATCDEEIRANVEEFGGNVIMTDPSIEAGLRVAVAAETLELDDDDIVVVVQGDEPLVHPKMMNLYCHLS